MVGVRAEQIPNRDSRVVLDDGTDRFGVPQVRVDWKLTDQDFDNLRTARTLLRSANASELADSFVETDWSPERIAGGAHHMGTTRMHHDPRFGVVDEHCRVHATSNVYMAGSSVFPTGGWAPPTLTIVALALRLADHVKCVGLRNGGSLDRESLRETVISGS
jgi:choline dehydrogenase-like flavoprotein